MRNKKLLISTSIIILLPVLAGLLLWSRLPEQIPIHWNAAGEVDGWSGKAFAVFGLPGFMLVIHLLCSMVTFLDPKNNDQGSKVLNLVLWICPVMSILASALVYGWALGLELSVEILMPVFMGILFIIIGNYLPKCKQNYTIGIKLPWTLDSEENWNATHRFAGKVWSIGGIVVVLTAFLNTVYALLGILLVMAFVPMLYSFLYYKKHGK